MKLRTSANQTFMFYITYFLFTYFGINAVGAALSACSQNQPGYDWCGEINVDCIISQNGDYLCQCKKDYWMFEGRCQKRADWCGNGEIGDLICKSNGTSCRSLEWTYETFTELPFKCECESKYVQSRVCSVSKEYCQKRGAKTYSYQNITLCDCENDQFFDYSISKCQNLDLCPFKQCTGKYEECHGSECVCKTSYSRDGKVCRPKKYCDSAICGNAKCEEGPEDDPKNVRCYCDSGYVLIREAGIPDCKLVRCESESLNTCDQLCMYASDGKSTSCGCLPGHDLKQDGMSCELLPSHKCSYNVCNSRSFCVKVDGRETCMCKNSLVGKEACLDRCAANELLPSTCPGSCNSTEGGFQCICEGKYKLSKNQVTCEERQMCLEGEEGLRNCSERNRTCIESPQTEEGYRCGECMNGLQEYEGICTVFCEVEEHRRFCEERGGTCFSVNALKNEVECKCRPLFAWDRKFGCVFARHSYTGMLRIFNSYEENPVKNSNDTLWYGKGNLDWIKLDHDISKSMLTLFGQALSGMNVLYCRYDDADENHEVCIICMIELQLHFKDYGILEKLNSYTSCRGSGNILGMFCFIPPYLKLVPRHRATQNVEAPFLQSNACGFPYGFSTCPASTNCVSEDIGFSCRCKKGFVTTTSVFLNNDKTGIMEVCQDINECEAENPCPNGTICINTIGDFECPCAPGLFRWNVLGNPKMDRCTRACDQVICLHGKCMDDDIGFHCRCDLGYTGLYCDKKSPGYDKDDKNTGSRNGHIIIIAVGIVEAIIFIFFIVVAVIFYRNKKRFKSKYVQDKKNMTPRVGSPQGHNTRNYAIDQIHMRPTVVKPNESFRSSLEEDPDEPIYADCTQIS